MRRILLDAAGTGAGVTDAYVIVMSSAPGFLYAWASCVDNTSSDPSFLRPLALP